MRHKVVFNLLGTFLFYLGLTMLVPFAVALYYGEGEAFVFFISAFITAVVGLFMRAKSSFSHEINLRESFLLVTLSWALAAAFGAIPFMLAGTFTSFIDAYFETISGFTTTGATLISDIEALPRSIIFWRSFTQWLGGMGIIALFVALLPRLGFKGMHLLKAELPGPITERVVPRAAELAKRLWLLYIVFSVAQAILLTATGLSLFDAVVHTFATMPTGGFSPYNASIAGLQNPAAEVVIIAFMFLAGGNFALYYHFVRGNRGHLLRDEEFRFYIFVNVAAIAIITATVFPGHTAAFGEALRQSVFQVVSILTTTGFVTANFDTWSPLARMLLLTLMFVGGSGGSTGGAIKQIRILLLFKYAYRELYRLIHPNAVLPLRLGGRAVDEDIVKSIVGFVLIYFFIFIGASLVLSAIGLDLITSFSAVAATLGNVGPGLGLVGAVHTYEAVPASGRVLLSFVMLLGRLEIYTVLIFFLPETRSPWRSWFRRSKSSTMIDYIEE